MPAPRLGDPLPNAAEAYVDSEKWHGYVLADEGHGADWRRAFGQIDPVELWAAVRAALVTNPVTETRDLDDLGTTCRVQFRLALNERIGHVRTIWHYEPDQPNPRLVSAYPVS